MPSANIEALLPSINKTFEDIRSHVSDIERHTAQRDRIIKAICDYVTQTITAESKSLLSSFYSGMMYQTLGNEPFLTVRNKNKFYDKDIRSIIFDRYNFSVSEDINYTQANEKCKALPIPAGTAGLGVILSVALSQVVIFPISLIIAGGLYYFISEYEKDKGHSEFMVAINRYINSVKGELIIWFEHIEAFYNEQVEELKRSIEGGHQ
jgi:hypothetical protein